MAQMTESPATSSQSHTRRYVFDLSHELHNQSLSHSIEIQVHEGSLSYSAIGFQTWNSAPLLCRRLVRDSFEFFPHLISERRQPCDANGNSKASRKSLKVLELGSGTGLVGLTAGHVLASILSWLGSLVSIDVEIILTDYHPEVLHNLRSNLELNKTRFTLPENCTSSLKVQVMKLDWRELEGSALVAAGLTGAFDVILGSDLVYEPEHAIWASNAVRYFLKPKPNDSERSDWSNSEESEDALTTSPADRAINSTEPQPTFHLLLPLRPTFTKESEAVHRIFGGSDLSLLLDRTDHSTNRFPIHSCEWEVSDTPKPKLVNAVLDSKALKIMQYLKEEGVKFGQGCGEYQYLQIRWVD